MEIKRLGEKPQFIDTVIYWINDEFGTEASKKFYQEIIEHSLEKDRLPITFVAVEEGTLLGTVGLWRADLLSRQELGPWMSALVVNKAHRSQGIGQELQKFVLNYAKEKGYEELYLYTDLKGYYEKSGWIFVEKGYEYSGEEIEIYKQTIEQ